MFPREFSKIPLLYLASPFTHKSRKVRRERIKAAAKASALLLKQNIMVLSPIALDGPWHEDYTLPCEWKFWESFDKNILERCDALLVLTIDGWDKSVGIKSEIEYAYELNMPIFYVTMEQIEIGDLKILNDYHELIKACHEYKENVLCCKDGCKCHREQKPSLFKRVLNSVGF